MNSVKNLVHILMAVMLVTFALPSVGAPKYTKQYGLTFTSGSTPTPVSLPQDPTALFTLTAHLTNKALGPGNSNIGSFKLTFTGVTIDHVSSTNPAIPAGNIQVTTSLTGSSVFVLLPTPLKGGQTFDLVIVFSSEKCGEISIAEETDVQVWTGNMGQTFAPIADTFPVSAPVFCGKLACGAGEDVPGHDGDVTVTRGDYDKNGDFSTAACAGIPYTYTSFNDNTLHFAWPDTITGNPHAAFELVVYSAGGSVPAAGTTGVAWLNTNGTPVTDDPKFITGNLLGAPTALNCLVPQVLPTPYGTLNAAINDTTDDSITIDGVAADPLGNPIVPATPFPVVIIDSSDATKTERLTATLLTGQVPAPQPPGYLGTYALTYDVTRGTATEGLPADKAPHAAGALVMSTPLPILPAVLPGTVSPPYVASTQVQMCIGAQVVVAPDPDGIHSTTFISIGDPWASQP